MIRRLTLGVLMLAPMAASALEFQFDNGVEISVDSTLTWGAQWRVEDRDDDLTGRQFLADLQHCNGTARAHHFVLLRG